MLARSSRSLSGACRGQRAARSTSSSIGWLLSPMGFACCATTTKRARVTNRHVGEVKEPYAFAAPEVLLADFWNDVEAWRTLELAPLKEVKRRALNAFKGRKQGARISFSTPELLFRLMTAKRWNLIRTMAGAGPLTIREVARRVERDV